MFIDFLTLVMINLVAGSVLLAYYLWKGMDEKDQRPYAAAFFITGLVGIVTGFQLSFTWPLPGSFNVGYGDATTLFGAVYRNRHCLMARLGFDPGLDLFFFAGIDAILVGLTLYADIWGRNLLWPPLALYWLVWAAWVPFRSCSGSGIIRLSAGLRLCCWLPLGFGQSPTTRHCGLT